MNKKIKKFIALIVAVLMLAQSFCSYATSVDTTTTSEDISINYQTAITMLNYLTVKTQEIKETKNRLLLDDVYDILYDGMHLDAVDKKTQDYIKKLANTIFRLKMSETKRDRIEYLWKQERAGAIKSAIPNPLGLLSSVRSWNLLSLITSGAYMIVDSVVGYNYAVSNANLEYLKNGWEIDDAELTDIDALNGYLWDYKNDMRRDNNIPSDLILNKDKIKEYAEWENQENVDRRIRFFEENIETYKGYPTIWLVLAKSYYEKAVEDMDEEGKGAKREYFVKCINAVDKYEKNQARIFVKDYDFAKIIPLAIASAEQVKSGSDYIEYVSKHLELLEKNIKNKDWDLQYLIGQTYLDLYSKTNQQNYLDLAYKKVYNNVTYLVPEQNKLNKEYLSDYVEVKARDGASKEEEKEIKEYNKKRKEEREYELPPILEPLELNCQLLFALAEKKKISESEKKTIDSILHNDNDYLFLLSPLDDLYWYNLSEEYKNIDYANDIQNVTKGWFDISINDISEESIVKATYTDTVSGNSKTYVYWYPIVDRKKNIATIYINKYNEEKDKLEDIDFKVDKNTKLHIEIDPIPDGRCKKIVADFQNDGAFGIFNGFERIK